MNFDKSGEKIDSMENKQPIDFSSMEIVPPKSPFENEIDEVNISAIEVENHDSELLPFSDFEKIRAIEDKEYYINMLEMQIKKSFPKRTLIFTAISFVLSFMGVYIFFKIRWIALFVLVINLLKRGRFEEEKRKAYLELYDIKNGGKS